MKYGMLILLSLLLAACAGGAAQSQENVLPQEPISEPEVSIYADALPDVLGRWVLEPGSEIYTDEKSVVHLQGRYQHAVFASTMTMTLSMYIDPAQAAQSLMNMLEQVEAGNSVQPITAVTERAYLVGYNQAALGLVNGNSVVSITLESGDQHTDLDVLNL